MHLLVATLWIVDFFLNLFSIIKALIIFLKNEKIWRYLYPCAAFRRA